MSYKVSTPSTWLIGNVQGNILMVIYRHLLSTPQCSTMHGMASIWPEDRTLPIGFLRWCKLDEVPNRTVEKREGPYMLKG